MIVMVDSIISFTYRLLKDVYMDLKLLFTSFGAAGCSAGDVARRVIRLQYHAAPLVIFCFLTPSTNIKRSVKRFDLEAKVTLTYCFVGRRRVD